MVSEGSTAPEFTLALAGGASYDDIETFALAEEVGDGPIILAFYPAAFTGGCTEEMCAFRDAMPAFEDLNARVYGVSVDLPFAQNVWIEQHDLGFPMLSDWDHRVIHEYDVVREGLRGALEVARRSIFVVDENGTVAYRWVRQGENPDFDALVSTVRAEIEAIT
jgi:peroxiredoxin